MIQKYKLTVLPNEDRRTVLLPDPHGGYVKYNDYLRDTEILSDHVFNLQQAKEDLIQVIIDLNNNLNKKERGDNCYIR